MSIPVSPAPTMPPFSRPTRSGPRLLYIDNIRLTMIILVVLIHLNVTYGQLGRWYYVESRALDLMSTFLFAAFGSFTQAYFMGLLFFIAGYFVPGSYEKKGPRRFIADRLFRLGLPTLVFMFILNPLTWLIQVSFPSQTPVGADSGPDMGSAAVSYITDLEFLSGTGPLWFTLALLLFSLVYVLVRWVKSRQNSIPAQSAHPISHSSVIALIIIMTLATFLVRLVQPVGTAFYNMQLCYFVQYVLLFILGTVAYRTDLLARLPYRFGLTWFKIAIIGGLPLWMIIFIAIGAMGGDLTVVAGGLHWLAFAYAFWESYFCVGFSLGLVVLFRERGNSQSPFTRFLSANAFGVYVFHTPILVSITLALQGVMLHPLLKMAVAALIVLPLCFGFSHLVRMSSGLRRLFS